MGGILLIAGTISNCCAFSSLGPLDLGSHRLVANLIFEVIKRLQQLPNHIEERHGARVQNSDSLGECIAFFPLHQLLDKGN